MIGKLFQRAASRLSTNGRPPKLIFLHVPKTGGTSLDRTLERRFPANGESNIRFGSVTKAWKFAQDFLPAGREEELTWFQTINTVLSYKIARGAPYLSGHFAISEQILEQARDSYRFITLLRDPVARWKSNYVYSRIREAQDGKRSVPQDIAAELQDYLVSPQAVKEGAKYIRYFGGYKQPERLGDETNVQRAIHLLARFDAVGFLEDLPRFETILSELLNQRLSVPHLRKTEDFREPGGFSASDYKALFDAQVTERVRELCQPDIRFYEYAKSMQASNAMPSAQKDHGQLAPR